MGALGDGPPFAVEEDERCEAVGIGGLEDSRWRMRMSAREGAGDVTTRRRGTRWQREVSRSLSCRDSGVAQAQEGESARGSIYSLLDDLVGEAIEGWRRDGRLVDAGATGVGRRGVHDALGL